MKTIRYTSKRGPQKIEIQNCGEVERGKTIDVPDEVAEELTTNRPDDFELVTKTAPRTKTTEDPNTDPE